jgi:hypothetical protein
MGNMPHVYRDRDIKRVIKAARDAGIEPGGVKVNPATGEITVFGGKGCSGQTDQR